MQKIKKPISILLVFMMILSVFTIVPISVGAAVGDYVAESDYLTFTAEEDGSSVTVKFNNGTMVMQDVNIGGKRFREFCAVFATFL